MSDKHRIIRLPGGREYYMATATACHTVEDRLVYFGATAYSDKSPQDAQAKADAMVAKELGQT